MITLPHIAAAFLVALVYAVICLVKPHRRCWRCRNTPGKSHKYLLGTAGPMVKCTKCGGRKKHPRRFSKQVHWFVWSAVIDPIRERRHDRGSGQRFAWAPAAPGQTPLGAHYAARLRAAQRADRLRQFQARLSARTAPRAWSFA